MGDGDISKVTRDTPQLRTIVPIGEGPGLEWEDGLAEKRRARKRKTETKDRDTIYEEGKRNVWRRVLPRK